MSWTASSSNGSPITGYTVTPIGPGGPLTPVAVGGGSTSTTVVTGLTNGTSYTFDVTATNGVGTSAAAIERLGDAGHRRRTHRPGSARPAAISRPACSGPPPPSTAARRSPATRSPRSAPADPSPQSIVDASTTGTVVTGLTDGTSYTFDVTADNARRQLSRRVQRIGDAGRAAGQRDRPRRPASPAAAVGPAAGRQP